MKYRIVEFEGTPEEFRAAGLGAHVARGNGTATVEQQHTDAWPEQGTSVPPLASQLAQDDDFLRRMLRRSPVSPGQLSFYRVLAQDRQGVGTPRKDIGKQMNRTQKE